MTKRQKILLITYWGLIFLSCGCVTSKRTKPCNQCPQYSFISYDTTIITIPHYNYNKMCFPGYKTKLITEEEIIIEKL